MATGDGPNLPGDRVGRLALNDWTIMKTPEQIAECVLPTAEDAGGLWPDGAEHWEPGAVRALIVEAARQGQADALSPEIKNAAYELSNVLWASRNGGTAGSLGKLRIAAHKLIDLIESQSAS